jgi:hypothetical protein
MAGMWDFPCFGPARADLSRIEWAPIAGGSHCGKYRRRWRSCGLPNSGAASSTPASCPTEAPFQSPRIRTVLVPTRPISAPPLVHRHHNIAGNTLPYDSARLGLPALHGRTPALPGRLGPSSSSRADPVSGSMTGPSSVTGPTSPGGHRLPARARLSRPPGRADNRQFQ